MAVFFSVRCALCVFFFQAEDGIRDATVTGVQTCALPIFEANWKILGENYSECYHCAPIHPELNRITHYTSGAYTAYFMREPRAPNFNGGFMEFSKDYTSMVWSGYTKRPPLKGMTKEDRRRVDYYFVFPHLFFSLHPDYLMVHRIWPRSPHHTTIECDWYFDAGVM